jgi:hypothetical protein
MGVEREEGGAEIGEEFLGGEAEMFGAGSKQDERASEAGDEHRDNVEEFDRVGGQGQDGRHDSVVRGSTGSMPGTDLEGVVESELDDFGLEAERAANDLADFWPVEFPRDAFTGQDGVFAAVGGIALAEASESAVVAGDDFVVATAFPGAGNELERFAGFGLEEKGAKYFEVRAGLAIRAGSAI